MPKTVLYVAIVVLVFFPALAAANQLDLFGFTHRAIGMANAHTALSEGPEACFYNPGALIESRNIRTFVGYSFSVSGLTLDIQEKDGGDMSDPLEAEKARSPEAGQWINAGVSGGIFDRVYFGLAMQVPIDGKSRRKVFSVDRPYFLDADTGIFGMTFIPAVAVQVAPNFGVGAGVRFTLDPFGQRYTDVPLTRRDDRTETLATSEFSGQAAPIFGFYARPFEFLRFGLTYRGQSYSYFHKTDREQLIPQEPDGFVEIEYEAFYNFIPRTLTFAVVGQPEEHVLVTGEFSWIGWSSYIPPYPEMRLNFKKMYDAGLYNANLRPDVFEREDADFNDTFTFRLGVEGRANKFLAFRAGYSFDPSVTPVQEGTTTIIDSFTHIFSFGMGGNFGGPEHDLVTIDFGLQDHYMTNMWVRKDKDEMQEEDATENPAYPRFEARGHNLCAGLTAAFRFF